MDEKNSYPRAFVELCPSEMLRGEIGLFSVRKIPGGMVIASSSVFVEETFISWPEWRQLDRTTREKLYAFCPGTENGIFAPPDINSLPAPWYINHSCEPNAGFDESGNLVTLKTISLGKEITWDYSTEERNPNYRMNCRCGSKKCRGVISSMQAPSAKRQAPKNETRTSPPRQAFWRRLTTSPQRPSHRQRSPARLSRRRA